MRVHFTYNDGDGVQQDGSHDYKNIDAAKREAILFLAQSLQESTGTTGVIQGAVAGLDAGGDVLFTISMNVTIEESGSKPPA